MDGECEEDTPGCRETQVSDEGIPIIYIRRHADGELEVCVVGHGDEVARPPAGRSRVCVSKLLLMCCACLFERPRVASWRIRVLDK